MKKNILVSFVGQLFLLLLMQQAFAGMSNGVFYPDIAPISSFERNSSNQYEWSIGGDIPVYTDLGSTDAERYDEKLSNGGLEITPLWGNGYLWLDCDATENTDAHNGNYAVNIAFTKNANGWFINHPQTGHITQGKRYRFSLWYKYVSHDSVQSPDPIFTVTFQSRSGQQNALAAFDIHPYPTDSPTYEQDIYNVSELWRKVEYVFIAPETSDHAFIVIKSSDQMTLLFDDFSLKLDTIDSDYNIEKTYNGTMEETSGTAVIGYETSNATQETYASGKVGKCMRINLVNNGSSVRTEAQHPFAIVKGNEYTANIWYRCTSTGNQSWGLVRWSINDADNNEQASFEGNIDPNATWQRIELSFYAKTTSSTCFFKLINKDDISINVDLDELTLTQLQQKYKPQDQYQYLHFATGTQPVGGSQNVTLTLNKSTTPVNLSNKNITFYLRVQDAYTSLLVSAERYWMWVFPEAYFYIYSGESYRKYRIMFPTKINDWYKVDINRGNYLEAQSSGDMNWNTITKFVIQLYPAEAQRLDVALDGMYAVEQYPEAFLSFTFGDTLGSQIRYAKPIFDKYGVKANMGIRFNRVYEIDDPMNGPWADPYRNLFDFLSYEDIETFLDAGWDVLPETFIYSDPEKSNYYPYGLDLYESMKVRWCFILAKRFLERMGSISGARFTFLPDFGVTRPNEYNTREIKKLYALTLAGGDIRSIPIVDRHVPFTSRMTVTGSSDVERVKKKIDRLVEFKGWFNFIFGGGSDPDDYYPAEAHPDFIEEIVAYAKDQGVKIVTASQIYDNVISDGNPDITSFENDLPLILFINRNSNLYPEEYGTIVVDTSNNDVELYLPSVVSSEGTTFTFIKLFPDNEVTIHAYEGETIQGLTEISLNNQYQVVKIISTGFPDVGWLKQ